MSREPTHATDAWVDRVLQTTRFLSKSGTRAPYKPLLLLWLVGRLANGQGTAATFAEAEDEIGRLLSSHRVAPTPPSATNPFVYLGLNSRNSGRCAQPRAMTFGRCRNGCGRTQSTSVNMRLADWHRGLRLHSATPSYETAWWVNFFVASSLKHSMRASWPRLGSLSMSGWRLPRAIRNSKESFRWLTSSAVRSATSVRSCWASMLG